MYQISGILTVPKKHLHTLSYKSNGRIGTVLVQFSGTITLRGMTMLFSHYIEERGYVVSIAEIEARYANAPSSTFALANLDLVALDTPFELLHVYGNFENWVKKTISKRDLRTCWESYSYIIWYCVDV